MPGNRSPTWREGITGLMQPLSSHELTYVMVINRNITIPWFTVESLQHRHVASTPGWI
jgi:hypothetical protein